jgi:hypothetical protein
MKELWKRISYAFRSFFLILFKRRIPEDVVRALVTERADAAVDAALQRSVLTIGEAPPEEAERAVQMLALLQRDGRLIDFLWEDIEAYADAQIGAAVRDVHTNCRQVIGRYLALEPVIASEEGQTVTIDDEFDPAAVKLVGNVPGRPPFRGVLRHRGWRVSRITLPPLANGQGRRVLAPAEVEFP